MHLFSEKRDTVGTAELVPNGSIARLAVVAEYRNRGMFRIAWFSIFTRANPGNRFYKIGPGEFVQARKEAGNPYVLANLDF